MRERRRRQEDPEEVDHREDRTTDWKSAAPRWLLLVLVCGGAAWGAFSSMLAWSFYEAHEAEKERRYSDWKAGAIADHEFRITVLERDAKNDRDDAARLDASNKLTRLQTQMETVTANMAALTNEVRKSLKEN